MKWPSFLRTTPPRISSYFTELLHVLCAHIFVGCVYINSFRSFFLLSLVAQDISTRVKNLDESAASSGNMRSSGSSCFMIQINDFSPFCHSPSKECDISAMLVARWQQNFNEISQLKVRRNLAQILIRRDGGICNFTFETTS